VIILDASVLIAHLDRRDTHHERAKRLLAETTGEQLGACTITLAETFVAPARAGGLADATEALERLGVRELSMGDGAAGRLAELRTETGHKMPDCCVLITAEEHRGTVASFDEALIEAAGDLRLATRG
jgi:predicted nucleic acid-binding protein